VSPVFLGDDPAREQRRVIEAVGAESPTVFESLGQLEDFFLDCQGQRWPTLNEQIKILVNFAA